MSSDTTVTRRDVLASARNSGVVARALGVRGPNCKYSHTQNQEVFWKTV